MKVLKLAAKVRKKVIQTKNYAQKSNYEVKNA